MSQDNSSFRLVQHIKCVTLWNVQWMAINMRNRSGLQMNKARRSTERGGAYGEYAYIIRVFIKTQVRMHPFLKDTFNLDEKAEAKYAADDYGKTSDSG